MRLLKELREKKTTKNDAEERRYIMAIRIIEMVMKCKGNYRMRKRVSKATLASKSLRILPYLSRNFIYYSAQADEMNCKFEFKECSLLRFVKYYTYVRAFQGEHGC